MFIDLFQYVVFPQTLSPQAKGLFQKAIFQSGVATVGNYVSSHSLGLVKVWALNQFRLIYEWGVSDSICKILV